MTTRFENLPSYPAKLRPYSWCFDEICGPYACWRPDHVNTQRESPIYWKNAIIVFLEREKWDKRVNENDLIKLINYIVGTFSILYTEEKGFFPNMKKNELKKPKFHADKYLEICKKLYLNKKSGINLLRRILKKSVEFYNKF